MLWIRRTIRWIRHRMGEYQPLECYDCQKNKKLKMKTFVEDLQKRKKKLINLPQSQIHIPLLRWNLPWNHIRSDWMLIRLFSIAEIISQIYQWQWNAKPQTQQPNHRSERNGSTWMLIPNEEIQEEACREHDSWIKCGGEKGSTFPFTSFHRFINSSRKVASN